MPTIYGMPEVHRDQVVPFELAGFVWAVGVGVERQLASRPVRPA